MPEFREGLQFIGAVEIGVGSGSGGMGRKYRMGFHDAEEF